ncbi:MAG: sulfotransferase domain-containing protein [Phycisphaerae bacterium]
MMSTLDRASVITIVSGLPRSGTAMMMRMLDAGGIPALTDNVRAADEDNPFGYFEYEPVKRTREDASWLSLAKGKSVKMVHLLLHDLPLDRQYHVVFMRRSLEEVVRSQNALLAKSGRQPDPSISDERVQEVFRGQLRETEEFLAANADVFHVLYTKYNEVIKHPHTAASAVNDFLGGSLNEEAMAGVVDASLYRQRTND